MFRKANTIPERNKFCLTKEQIIEDIEAICHTEDQRNKLYYCIDEKPPQEHKFEKIEEFLKGTQDLERNSNILLGLKNEIENLQRQTAEWVTSLKEATGNI
ncbi:hypothetical protein BDFB_003168 [Asbolus verrucosus]|uniref:Uncharacterized protein n=1 Tax=Asbolus verrucosus TaxID=1661398 RepID=A0A482W031_ASBVE|nr:hypothetical protein BDFB_003168 [Asbolus verrucosus]